MAEPATPASKCDDELPAVETTSATGAPPASVPASAILEAELLVEDVSIDGMCGVY